MRWFLAEPRSMLHLSCHFPGTLPMNKRGKIEKMTAGEIFAVVVGAPLRSQERGPGIFAQLSCLPSPECTYECVLAEVYLFVKVTMPLLCKLFVPLVVYHSIYVCIYSTCVLGH